MDLMAVFRFIYLVHESVYSFSWRNSWSSWGSPSSWKTISHDVNWKRVTWNKLTIWTGIPLSSPLDKWSTMIVPSASHITLIVVRNRSLELRNLSKLWKKKEKSFFLQKPIDSNDDCNIFGRQANSIKNHNHCNQTSLRNSSGTNRSGSGGDTETIILQHLKRTKIFFCLTWQQQYDQTWVICCAIER